MWWILRRFSTRGPTHTPPDPDPRVLYMDRAIIALNKPPGVSSQETQRHDLKEGTISPHVDALVKRYMLEIRPYLVHRLDKPTTGVLILARNKTYAKALMRQWTDRAGHSQVEKVYLALVAGNVERSTGKKQGTITLQLQTYDGRVTVWDSRNPLTAPVTDTTTEWKVEGYSSEANITFLRLKLVTGHKHQLRVHLSHALQTPILNDWQYGPPADYQRPNVSQFHLFLHASSMSLNRFRKEGGNKRYRLQIIAPLPGEFVTYCANIGISLRPEDVEGAVFVDGERVGVDDLGRPLKPSSPESTRAASSSSFRPPFL